MRMLSTFCIAAVGGLGLILGTASVTSAGEQPVSSQLSSDGNWTAFRYKGQMLSDDASVRVTGVTCTKDGSKDPFTNYAIGVFRRSGDTPCSGVTTKGQLPTDAKPVLPDGGGLEYKPHFNDLCVSSKGNEKFNCQLQGVATY